MEIVPLYTHLEEAGTTRIRIILLQKDDLQRCTGGSREKHYQMILRIKKRCVREYTNSDTPPLLLRYRHKEFTHLFEQACRPAVVWDGDMEE